MSPPALPKALLAALALLLLASGEARAAGILDTLFTAQEWQAKGDLPAARETVLDALKQGPDDSFARIRLAQLDAALGNPGVALKSLDAVLLQDPDNQLALLWKGHILLGPSPPGDTAQARECYQRVLAKDPANAWAMAGMGICLLAEGTPQAAVPLLEKAQALAGDDGPLHHVLGDTYAAMGLMANARMELEQALEENQRDLPALVGLGGVYMRLGLESLALNAWQQALTVDPTNGEARARLVAVLSIQARKAAASGRSDDATRLWRTIMGYDPGNAEALWNLRNPGEPARGAALHPPGGIIPPGPPQ